MFTPAPELSVRSRLRRLATLPPLQARARVLRLRDRVHAHGDVLLVDALDLLARLLAARAWLRHDPGCQHRSPTHSGPSICTCGLSATLRGEPADPAASS